MVLIYNHQINIFLIDSMHEKANLYNILANKQYFQNLYFSVLFDFLLKAICNILHRYYPFLLLLKLQKAHKVSIN